MDNTYDTIKASLNALQEYKTMLANSECDDETRGFAERGIEGEKSFLAKRGIEIATTN